MAIHRSAAVRRPDRRRCARQTLAAAVALSATAAGTARAAQYIYTPSNAATDV